MFRGISVTPFYNSSRTKTAPVEAAAASKLLLYLEKPKSVTKPSTRWRVIASATYGNSLVAAFSSTSSRPTSNLLLRFTNHNFVATDDAARHDEFQDLNKNEFYPGKLVISPNNRAKIAFDIVISLLELIEIFYISYV